MKHGYWITEQRKAKLHRYELGSVAYLMGLTIFSPKELPFISYYDPKLMATK